MARTLRYRRKRGVSRRSYVRRGRRLTTKTQQKITKYVPRGNVQRAARTAAGAVGRAGAYLGKRAATSLARSVVNRYKRARTAEHNREKAGGYYTGQYDKYAFKFGRKRGIMSHLAKMDRRNAGYSIERFGSVARLTDTNGVYALNVQDYGASGYAMPIYLLALDATNKAATPGPVLWRMYENSSAAVTFNSVVGTSNTGSGSTSIMSNIKDNLFSSVVDDNYIVEWSNIKMLFRCPIARSGYVKVQLVQFPEVYLQPDLVSSDQSVHWGKVVKELMYSPLTTEVTATGRPYQNGCRILKTWTKNFSPGDSGNESHKGQQVRMDLFLRHNRYVNRQLRQGTKPTNFAALDDDAYTVESEALNSIGDRPADRRARIFLMISGTNFDAPQTEFDPTKHISFDLEFRGKRVWARSNAL